MGEKTASNTLCQATRKRPSRSIASERGGRLQICVRASSWSRSWFARFGSVNHFAERFLGDLASRVLSNVFAEGGGCIVLVNTMSFALTSFP